MKKKKQQKKSILVIGMGRFGKHLAMKFQDTGNTVMAVDKNENVMAELAPRLENIMVADCTSEAFIQTLGIGNFDICYVAIGENFEASILITSFLKRYGAKRIVTKAARDIQIEILKRVGADEVIYPERELAEKIAVRHSSLSIIDCLPLSEEYSIYEIEVPEEWIGKSIGDLNIRRKYHLNILTVNNASVHPMPEADHVFSAKEQIVLLGTEQNVLKVCPRA